MSANFVRLEPGRDREYWEKSILKLSWIAVGGASALVAVMLGAFGAHALEGRLTAHYLEVFKTAAYYQMVHALALILIGQRAEMRPQSRLLPISCGLMAAGVAIFCGSLYILAVTGERRLGMIAPLGGLSFMAGWAAFVIAEITVRRLSVQ